MLREVSSKNFIIILVLVVIGFWRVLFPAFAADLTATNKRLPRIGLIAVSSISGAGSSVTGDVFGEEDIFGKERSPITGAVSRAGEGYWSFSVFNNSESRYSVNIDLIQRDESGSNIKFSSYSYTLHPGQSNGDRIQSGFGASKAELYLRSFRDLSPKDSSFPSSNQSILKR